MANISKISFNGETLDIKDTHAREQLKHLTADNYTADVTGDYTVNAGNKMESVTGTTTENLNNINTTVTGKWSVNLPNKSFDMENVALKEDVKAEIIKSNGICSPEDFGANEFFSESVDDAPYIILALKSKKVVILKRKYSILTDIIIPNSGVIIGKNASIQNLVANVTSDNCDFFMVNSTIYTTKTNALALYNVGFYGKNGNEKALNIQSFRNLIFNCNFENIGTAIELNDGVNWTGENRICNNIFNKVNLCISLKSGSDGYITDNICDSNTTTFISGGYDSGYIIRGNHLYNKNGTDIINGVNTLFEGNYIDGIGRLVITGNGGFNCVGNMFLYGGYETNKNVLTFTSGTINNGSIVSNSVEVPDSAVQYEDLTFINIDQCNYFNNVIVSGNSIRNCGNIYSNTYHAYYKELTQPIAETGTVLSGTAETNVGYVSSLISTNHAIINGPFTSSNIFRGTSGYSWLWKVTKTSDSGTQTSVIGGDTLTLDDYASLTKCELWGYGIPLDFRLPGIPT